jgi:hypothetical protein
MHREHAVLVLAADGVDFDVIRQQEAEREVPMEVLHADGLLVLVLLVLFAFTQALKLGVFLAVALVIASLRFRKRLD